MLTDVTLIGFILNLNLEKALTNFTFRYRMVYESKRYNIKTYLR